ncbi:unnamed protein product [Kuraishia capsulata CBS 1993]|uniref:VPS10 domain-containing protein n=1 Tax=Kuraishia capsulata CBS 1993 TaxID=1382522 RepID=W6MRP0_9ASCO|nr:uncharacterized protein KUCA_T00004999001 [Kuraishia capsulata CBS 1993]CDK29013.1 unnamed protein product [Kuraishia capsulata CBS 1993]
MVSIRSVTAVLVSALFAQCALGADTKAADVGPFQPTIHTSDFGEIPSDLFYFDDSAVVMTIVNETVYRSDDDGKTWKSLNDDLNSALGTKETQTFVSMEYPRLTSNRVIVFTEGLSHLISDDKGQSWRRFDMPDVNDLAYADVRYNHVNEDMMLISNLYCNAEGSCNDTWFYTTDGLRTHPVPLPIDDIRECRFAKSSATFSAGPDSRILCIQVTEDGSGSRLISTDDFFTTIEECKDSMNSLNSGEIVELVVIQSFIVAIVEEDKYAWFSNVHFFVSKDGSQFQKVDFGSNLNKQMYSFLDSTPYSLNVVLYGFKNSMDIQPVAEIYQSDSSGVHYTKIQDNVMSGTFGFTAANKVSTIDGAWIINKIDSAKGADISFKTLVTIDNGRTWNPPILEDDADCKGDDACSLNIISVGASGSTKMTTGPTPGIVMGVGRKGSGASNDLKDLDTYVSRDGGITWRFAFKGISIFSFGDQGNIIIALRMDLGFIFDAPMVYQDTVLYSTDQGLTWSEAKLDKPILPLAITTTIDGSSKNFLIVGQKEAKKDSQDEIIYYSLDFSDAFDRTCGAKDFEEWYSRVDSKTKEPVCVFGHVEKFNRRKQDANCFVNTLYKDVEAIEVPCICTEDDFECALGFAKNEKGSCEPVMTVITENFCSNPKKTIKLTSKVKAPGNLCQEKNGFKPPANDFSISCSDAIAKSKLKNIQTTASMFSEKIVNYFYLETQKSDQVLDETILLSTAGRRLYVSYNGGITFDMVDSLKDADGKIVAIYTNPYYRESVYVITSDSKIYYSEDSALTFSVVDAPTKLNEFGLRQITFNKADPKSFIWYGEKGCKSYFSQDCHVEASYTQDGGKTFKPLIEDVRMCNFVGSTLDIDQFTINPNLIFCEKFSKTSQFFQLVSTTDFFEKTNDVLFERIIGSADTGEFIVVAQVNDDQTLSAFVTVDGLVFAPAEFPANFKVDKQQAYTVMDVSSKSIFLHVTTFSEIDKQFGTILKSNYNGTSYIVSLPDANRDNKGYVDFEKVETLEGISVVNVVANADKVRENHESKKLKTKITHNDGAEWSFVQPPAVDSEGNTYKCKGKSLKDCSLNFHGYTERKDVRDTYSSGSAVGMMIATGNVGEYLLPASESNTFFTQDAGVTWKEVKKGAYTWEFGDQGSIIVLVKPEKNQKTLWFSLDQAQTWEEYEFSKDPVSVVDLGTVPSDTSRKFVILAEDADSQNMLFTVDFTRVHNRQCSLDLKSPTGPKSDFEYWSPKHPFLADNCLFGHESEYLRKKPKSSDCFIGMAPLNEAFKVLRNCSCSRRDYECDYNYAMAEDGTCKLISGLSPLDPVRICTADPDLLGYWEPTGYRKVPLSTCESGLQLDKWTEHPCPGKKNDFNKKHGSGITGFGLFAVIFVPIAVFLAATWFVYDRGIRRNGGFSRFGEIRLDEDDELHLIEENNTDIVVNNIVRGLFAAVGNLVQTTGVIRNFLRTQVFRLGANSSRGYTRFGADSFFSHEDEDESLFRYATDDDDAREIDNFLDEGFDAGDEDDMRLGGPYDGAEDGSSPASPDDFNVDDEEDDGDLGSSRN